MNEKGKKFLSAVVGVNLGISLVVGLFGLYGTGFYWSTLLQISGPIFVVISFSELGKLKYCKNIAIGLIGLDLLQVFVFMVQGHFYLVIMIGTLIQIFNIFTLLLFKNETLETLNKATIIWVGNSFFLFNILWFFLLMITGRSDDGLFHFWIGLILLLGVSFWYLKNKYKLTINPY